MSATAEWRSTWCSIAKAVGSFPGKITCRGVVDGISMVIHMMRREGRRFVAL